MGLLDWVTLGRIDQNGASAGQFHMTLGTTWNATGGTSCEHVIGSAMNLTFDPVDTVLPAIYASGPSMLGSILSGMGGKSDFVYGSSTQALYGGPHFHLQRARDIEKKSNWFLRPKSHDKTVPAPDPLEPTTTAAIIALSALINLVPLAFEIALYVSYKEYCEPKKDGPIHKEPELLKFMAYAITTRLMALIRTMEIATADVQVGAKLVEELAGHLNRLRNVGSWIINRFKSNKKEAKMAEWMSEEAIEMHNLFLADLAEGKGW
jgi:hypothetical protein